MQRGTFDGDCRLKVPAAPKPASARERPISLYSFVPGLVPGIHEIHPQLTSAPWVAGPSPATNERANPSLGLPNSVLYRSGWSPRQETRVRQEFVDRAGALPAFADRPDDERLAAPHVAGGKYFRH
jgi:hypothetical protein